MRFHLPTQQINLHGDRSSNRSGLSPSLRDNPKPIRDICVTTIIQSESRLYPTYLQACIKSKHCTRRFPAVDGRSFHEVFYNLSITARRGVNGCKHATRGIKRPPPLPEPSVCHHGMDGKDLVNRCIIYFTVLQFGCGSLLVLLWPLRLWEIIRGAAVDASMQSYWLDFCIVPMNKTT